jgi:uncharacterized protein YcfJ
MIGAVVTRLIGVKLGGYATLAAMTFVAAVIAGAYWKGWSDRGVREELRVERLISERRAQAARIAAQAETLVAVRAERDRLAEELENAALADHDADRPALGFGSVQRLNER